MNIVKQLYSSWCSPSCKFLAPPCFQVTFYPSLLHTTSLSSPSAPASPPSSAPVPVVLCSAVDPLPQRRRPLPSISVGSLPQRRRRPPCCSVVLCPSSTVDPLPQCRRQPPYCSVVGPLLRRRRPPQLEQVSLSYYTNKLIMKNVYFGHFTQIS